MIMNATTTRVPQNVPTSTNEAIRSREERRLAYYAAHVEEIPARLDELDHEWDIERLIETEGPATTAVGMALGAFVDRRFLALAIFAQSMMLLHAVQGWYPMLPLFRQMGFRTVQEIDGERRALEALQRRAGA